MDESTLLLLAGLGVLAWLLAGGLPYVRDRYLADDGPLGIGAGVTAVCPGCVRSGATSLDADVAVRAAVGRPVPVPAETGGARAVGGLRPLAVGRDETLRLECPACGSVYVVLGVPSVVVPAPRVAAD
jgi:hypothetical protein